MIECDSCNKKFYFDLRDGRSMMTSYDGTLFVEIIVHCPYCGNKIELSSYFGFTPLEEYLGAQP